MSKKVMNNLKVLPRWYRYSNSMKDKTLETVRLLR